MKNRLLISVILFCLIGCGGDYEHMRYTHMYEFIVENQFRDKTITIVPKSRSNMDFWITSNENYIVIPNEKIIIGYKIVNNNDSKLKDIYKPDDVIEPFELFIDDIKQEKNFSLRKFWNFSIKKKNESGEYLLIINEYNLKN